MSAQPILTVAALAVDSLRCELDTAKDLSNLRREEAQATLDLLASSVQTAAVGEDAELPLWFARLACDEDGDPAETWEQAIHNIATAGWHVGWSGNTVPGNLTNRLVELSDTLKAAGR